MRRFSKYAWIGMTVVLIGIVVATISTPMFQKWRRTFYVGSIGIDPGAPIEIDTSYELILWESPSPVPWETEHHAALLRGAVADFQRAWPNITVQWRIVDDGTVALREALAKGNPPDVLGTGPGPQRFGDAWQVPVSPYMSDEAKNDTIAPALKALTVDDTLWGWPRWMALRLWVVRNDLTPDDISSNVATTSDFIQTARTIKNDLGIVPVALNPFDPQLLADVIMATTGQPVVGPDGRRAWSESDMAQALSFFQSLVEEGLTGTQPDAMARRRVADFWNQQAAFIAPTTPMLVWHFLTRGSSGPGNVADNELFTSGAGESPYTLAEPIPPPASSDAASRYNPADIASFIVFTRDPYPGDGHTKAAMMLAEHLSRTLGPVEAASMLASPVHPSTFQRYVEDTSLLGHINESIVRWTHRAVVPAIDDTIAVIEQRALRDIVAPELIKLWHGEDAETVAANMAMAIDGLSAQVK